LSTTGDGNPVATLKGATNTRDADAASTDGSSVVIAVEHARVLIAKTIAIARGSQDVME
jgi:hypothetical protein